MSTVLGIDSSGKTAGVCLLQNGQVIFEKVLNQGLTHSETLMPLVATAFAESGLSPEDINLYAVSAGPGSFTGLRIGMALVKGLALPHGTKAAAVPTLEALAYACYLDGMRGTIIPALDARRGEVYWAAFSAQGGFSRITQDAADPAEETCKNTALYTEPIFFVGDGAYLCYNIYHNMESVRQPEANFSPSIAKGAAFLAARSGGCSAAEIYPSYLRKSQAERQRAERLAAQVK